MNKIISVETQIITLVIKALLAANFYVEVFDGEEVALERVGVLDPFKVLAAMRATDEDYLRVYTSHRGDHQSVGWVRFVYGNDDTEVISDYTTNLESIMKPIDDAITKFEETRGI